MWPSKQREHQMFLAGDGFWQIYYIQVELQKKLHYSSRTVCPLGILVIKKAHKRKFEWAEHLTVYFSFFSNTSLAVGMRVPALLAVLTGNYPLIIPQHAQGFYAYKNLIYFFIPQLPVRHLLLLILQKGLRLPLSLFHLCPLPVDPAHGMSCSWNMPGTNGIKSSLTWTETESSVEKTTELVSVFRYAFFCLNFIKALLLNCIPAIWWNLVPAAHLWGAIKKCKIPWGNAVFPMISWAFMV